MQNRETGFRKFVRDYRSHRFASREKNPRKTKSRQLLIAERKALRRHRGPQS